MDPGPAPGRLSSERGFASLQFTIAAALALVLVVGLVQVVAYQYARGAMLTALERGVRAGSVVGAGAAECRAAVADSLTGVLGGAVGASLGWECVEGPEVIAARGTGVVPAWLGGGPQLEWEVTATARREALP